VKIETFRALDQDIMPEVATDTGEGDGWLRIHDALLASA
jgi:hypothetical protein